MAGKGPAPMKNRDTKRRPNSTPGYKRLPHEGRDGPLPLWPLPSNPDLDDEMLELSEWERIWKLPQAIEWERMQCETLVALYCRVYVRAMKPSVDTKLLSEVRQLDSKLGLSPRAMQDLRWETDEAPLEDDGASTLNGDHAPYVPQSS